MDDNLVRSLCSYNDYYDTKNNSGCHILKIAVLYNTRIVDVSSNQISRTDDEKIRLFTVSTKRAAYGAINAYNMHR